MSRPRGSWAATLATTIPLIYGAGPLAVVAYRWKTQLNENAKMHAFSHAFPEVGHNEIEGWAGAHGRNFAAVFLRDEHQLAANATMLDAAQELIADDAVVTAVVEAAATLPTARAFSLVAQGDWVSYYAGLERGVDPGRSPGSPSSRRAWPEAARRRALHIRSIVKR